MEGHSGLPPAPSPQLGSIGSAFYTVDYGRFIKLTPVLLDTLLERGMMLLKGGWGGHSQHPLAGQGDGAAEPDGAQDLQGHHHPTPAYLPAELRSDLVLEMAPKPGTFCSTIWTLLDIDKGQITGRGEMRGVRALSIWVPHTAWLGPLPSSSREKTGLEP